MTTANKNPGSASPYRAPGMVDVTGYGARAAGVHTMSHGEKDNYNYKGLGSCAKCGMPVRFPELGDEPQDVICESCGTKHTLPTASAAELRDLRRVYRSAVRYFSERTSATRDALEDVVTMAKETFRG